MCEHLSCAVRAKMNCRVSSVEWVIYCTVQLSSEWQPKKLTITWEWVRRNFSCKMPIYSCDQFCCEKRKKLTAKRLHFSSTSTRVYFKCVRATFRRQSVSCFCLRGAGEKWQFLLQFRLHIEKVQNLRKEDSSGKIDNNSIHTMHTAQEKTTAMFAANVEQQIKRLVKRREFHYEMR